jgi:hypothetical protein
VMETQANITHDAASCRALWAAVINQALHDYWRCRGWRTANPKDRTSMQLTFNEVSRWLFKDDLENENSLINLCDWLEIAPHHVRRAARSGKRRTITKLMAVEEE